MSTYLFSLLSDAAVLEWQPETDLLRFDDPAISAASLQFSTSADGRSVLIADGAGKSVTLLGAALFQLDATHLVFADGSRLVLPTIANSFGFDLVGGSGNDLLLGAAPARALAGAATNNAGTAGSNGGQYASLSGDGRLVAFHSFGSDLVASDANNTNDIFVKDLVTGATVRASTSSAGIEANGSSNDPRISLNGRFVVFQSTATNLVAADDNATGDIFVKDLLTGVTTRVSTGSLGEQANGGSFDAAISGSGRFIVFNSSATNLVPGDTNGFSDIFLKDQLTGSTTLLSRTNVVLADSGSSNAVISTDGRSVAFESFATNLVGGDTNGVSDIFVRNVSTGSLVRASTDSTGAQVNGASAKPSLSADGRYVCFESGASNLVSGDTNGSGDVFVKDLVSQEVRLVSQRADGTQGNSFSGNAAISGDGRYVAFYSVASNLADGDHNGWYDVFVKDLQTGALQRLSVAPDGSQGIATIMTFSWHPAFSADGSTITFTAPSRSLLPGDPSNAVTVYTVSNPLLGVTLAGGAGNDVYEIHRASDAVVEAAASGIDTVRSSVSLALAANVENLVLTGTASIDATGNAGSNVLTGNAGDNVLDGGAGTDTASFAAAAASVTVSLDLPGVAQDTGAEGIDTLVSIENLTGSAFDDFLLGDDANNVLDGGAGADVLIGGGGNDVYVLDRASDEAIELAGAGTDTVRAGFSHTLAAEIENLVLTGTANINATGNTLNNILAGNSGSNRLDGGAGTDAASYLYARTGVVVGLDRAGPQATGAGIDTLVAIETLIGSNFNDTLHGNAGANTLNGGNGVDTVSYARATAAVTVNLALTTSQNTVGAGADLLLGFENLTGSAFADRLAGNSGANLIDGGLLADTMTGGAGNDRYVVQDTLDVVVEAASGGTDTVLSSVGHTLADNVENLTLTGSANINATGNGAGNVLAGNAGANILNGGGGTDTASYAGFTLSVAVNLATGLATGGGGSDSLLSIENVVGGAAGDALVGNNVANVLNGGAGADTLTGGAGADTFVFDSLVGADTVTDFVSGSDRVRISQAGVRIGDGDTTIEGGTLLGGPGGFAVGAELVIFTNDIAGAISASSAAAAIGAATSAYAFGATALFVVDNGSDSALYRFSAAGPDAFVSAGELTLMATFGGTGSTALSDYLFAG